MLVRLALLFTVLLLIQLYAFQGIRMLTNRSWILIAYWVLGVLVLANVVYQFNTGSSVRGLTPQRSYAIAMMLVLAVFNLVVIVFVLGEDIVRLSMGVYRKIVGTPTEGFLPERRKFVSQMAMLVAAIPFSSMLYGIFKGKYNYKVLKYQLYFPDLPEAFDGYKITQISDIHSGSFDNKAKIEYAVDLINEQKSDTILFTGDLVNDRATEMEPWKNVFGRLSAKDGVYSILGNHDYGDYTQWDNEAQKAQNLEDLKSVQAEMGFRLLLNEHVYLERGGEKIALVGVENWGTGGFKQAGDLKKASNGLTNEEFKILMSHDPSHWEAQVIPDEKKFHLTLSGHTHGMQFGIEIPGWVKWSPVQWRYKQWAGIYSKNDHFINVNRGFGYLAFPGRVGIWPEITQIELKRGKQPESLSA